VKKIRVFLASIVFLVLAYFCYSSYSDYFGMMTELGSETSFLYAAITFVLVAITVLTKGLTAGGKDDDDVIDPIYRGNSWLLGGLIRDGVKQSVVQDIAEPFLFLALGFFLFSYNYIWGIPFIFCAIACWLHLAIESIFGFFGERRDLSNQGHLHSKNYAISKIIS